MYMFNKNALIQALVSKGYNQIDAQNAANGPRAAELAKEYLGSGAVSSGNSAGDAAQKILDAQKQIIDTSFILNTFGGSISCVSPGGGS